MQKLCNIVPVVSIESRFNIEMSMKELTFSFSFELSLHFNGIECLSIDKIESKFEYGKF